MTEISEPKITQGDKRRKICEVLKNDYGIISSRDTFDFQIKFFSYGIPEMEKFESWDAVDFILDDNIELFAFFIYGLNAFKNYQKTLK